MATDTQDKVYYQVHRGTLHVWGLLFFVGMILTGVFLSISTHRNQFHRTENSAMCNDMNQCTNDYVATKLWVSHCEYENKPNGVACSSNCYEEVPTCQDGECQGVCKGNCEERDDCPSINTVDFIDLGFNDSSDYVILTKSCAISNCFYGLFLSIEDPTDFDNINTAMKTVYGDLSEGYVNTSSWGWDIGGDWTMAYNNLQNDIYPAEFDTPLSSICMSLIHSDWHDCLFATKPYLMTANNNVPPSYAIWCHYTFKCNSERALLGEIEFA